MVKQKHQVFDLSDVLQVALQCSHCKGEISNSIVDIQLTDSCPQCGKMWEPTEPNGYRGKNWELLRAMKQVINDDRLPVTIRFKVDGDETEEAA